MKKLLVITTLLFFCCKVLFAASITDELTKLNNLYKEGAITEAAAVGVSTDLEAAAQGLGYGSFADAVAAYNEQYGTNYTVDSAKEALGQ